MKMVKSLVLGSAAGLLVVGGAQAADLPVKAKAVEYVKVCSLYGADFYYIPGTDTCIKLGGYLRAEMGVNVNSVQTGNTGLPASANNRFTNAFTWRGRQDLSVDTRTATEYGVVRTFSEFTLTWGDDSFAVNPAAPGSTVYSPIGGGAVAGIAPLLGNVAPGSAPNNANAGAVAGGTLGVYYAYIQFAGFTIGKAISQFSAPWTNYPGNNFDGLVGGGGDVTGVNQFTYTAEFGQGVSAAISVQDPTAYYQAGVNNLSAGGLFGASDYAGTIAPDIVGMVRIDQAWGMVQFSAAAHDNHVAYYGATEPTGHPDDKWGFAVQGALTIKNIPTGPGDTINVQGVYTNGATRYNIQDLAAQAGAAQIYGGSNVAYQSVGLGVATDTIFAAGTQQQLTETWGMRGAFNHNWDPYWSSSLYGAWAAVHYNGTAKGLICGTPGIGFGVAAAALVTTCNPDYNIAQVGFITRWTPVKNLTFSADVTWEHLDQKFAGFLTAPNVATGKPAVAYELKDQDTVQLLLRAQRNF
ncbi:MAG: porin [Bradyrhizobium sp.]|uniref:porin n=1 Tax=Bradyrhizobium sp. TaxID=376 RepID=UPI001D25387D|nr:porin [Bradyrhizobium sp.]MBV9562540.1 porin [Bradyrhizobium sp.]